MISYVTPNFEMEARFWDFVLQEQQPYLEQTLPFMRSVLIQEQEEIEEIWQLIAHLITYRQLGWEHYKLVQPYITSAAHGSEQSMLNIIMGLDNAKLRSVESHAAVLYSAYDCVSNLETSVLTEHSTLRSFHGLLEYTGLHSNKAYDVCIDLTKPLQRTEGKPICRQWQVSKNQWCPVSTRCEVGLELMGVKGPQQTLCRALREIATAQVYMLGPRGFRWLYDERDQYRALDLSDIHDLVCRFVIDVREKMRCAKP